MGLGTCSRDNAPGVPVNEAASTTNFHHDAKHTTNKTSYEFGHKILHTMSSRPALGKRPSSHDKDVSPPPTKRRQQVQSGTTSKLRRRHPKFDQVVLRYVQAKR